VGGCGRWCYGWGCCGWWVEVVPAVGPVDDVGRLDPVSCARGDAAFSVSVTGPGRSLIKVLRIFMESLGNTAKPPLQPRIDPVAS
jgi:hypothetical protein